MYRVIEGGKYWFVNTTKDVFLSDHLYSSFNVADELLIHASRPRFRVRVDTCSYWLFWKSWRKVELQRLPMKCTPYQNYSIQHRVKESITSTGHTNFVVTSLLNYIYLNHFWMWYDLVRINVSPRVLLLDLDDFSCGSMLHRSINRHVKCVTDTELTERYRMDNRMCDALRTVPARNSPLFDSMYSNFMLKKILFIRLVLEHEVVFCDLVRPRPDQGPPSIHSPSVKTATAASEVRLPVAPRCLRWSGGAGGALAGERVKCSSRGPVTSPRPPPGESCLAPGCALWGAAWPGAWPSLCLLHSACCAPAFFLLLSPLARHAPHLCRCRHFFATPCSEHRV